MISKTVVVSNFPFHFIQNATLAILENGNTPVLAGRLVENLFEIHLTPHSF